ncbi:LamG-like jellyroll fold domain-containing protein [Paenibacillus sp. FSL E2-0178]|uniref:LamG-like jellyroll fold domain-containing protein n=1 Tax=Paenibacillus sp. FSL E2-0178 TaxID=2921361 RepID=UPI0031589D76
MPNTQDNMARCGVAWFKMDELSGNITDSKGSLIGTQTNVTRTSGVSGNALNFVGNGIVQFQDTVLPRGKKSIRFKVKTTQTTGGTFLNTGVPAATSSNPPAYGFFFGVENGRLILIYYHGSTVNLRVDIISKVLINDGKWHDILFTWDGTTNTNAAKLYVDNMETPDSMATYPVLDTTPHSVFMTLGRTNNTSFYYYYSGLIDELEIYNDVIQPVRNRSLIFHNGLYKRYTTFWEVIAATVTDADYMSYGMSAEKLSSIPEGAWSSLSGIIELFHFADDGTASEAQFNIETTPFTLAEEWENKTIKVIEYTDNPAQTESVITMETEPFSLYDELGDTVDVLYYTDDTTKTYANLTVTANYTPLDEINGDFEVVTWTDSQDIAVGSEPTLAYEALPFEQLITSPVDITTYGSIKSLVASKITQTVEGTLKFITSFDSGATWKVYKFGKWSAIDILNKSNIKKNGMTLETINSIPESALVGLKRIGYYLDNSIHRSGEVAQLDYLKMISSSPTQDVKFSDVAFYLLNTTATIQLQLQGNKLVGELNDADTGRVQYRVILNGNYYYPNFGDFSPLLPSPQNIQLNLSEKDVLFGQENVLKVEFKDYWGQVDSWQTTFIGTYSGIMFKDESGNFYSNSFGEILKRLEFGTLFAGQTTLEQKVIVKNQLGVKVQNLILEIVKEKLPPGVFIELSRSNFPFASEDPLLFNMFFDAEDEFEFYVRIVTQATAPTAANGQFEIRAKADPV